MSTTNTRTRIDVMLAIDEFCKFATEHPSTPRHEWGEDVFFADTPGQKFTRIVQATKRPDGTLTGRSVHAFVDNFTGDLYKAAGWKAPAKGVRGNLLSGLLYDRAPGKDTIRGEFTWSGGYLYMR